ncbi:DMT family transporter [Kiloniella sp. b19]|uniref:DMT family transporter n=1 Tax=Kiloniella sp. GXU_MW_B19 TaxID=3141326 RepID=UPI0031D33B54
MDTTLALIVLTSAVLHPLWNALIKGRDNQRSYYIVFTMGLSFFAFLTALWHGHDFMQILDVWPYALWSLCGQFFYGIGLIYVLRHGDLSAFYPIVRSTPLVVVLASVLFFSASYSLMSLLFIGMVLLGGVILQYRRGKNLLENPRILGMAILALFGTGFYSLADAEMVQRIPASVTMAWVDGINAVLMLVFFTFIDRSFQTTRNVSKILRHHLPFALLIGALGFGSYQMILYTFAQGADVALVSTLRQASIPVSVLIGGLYFREGAILRRFLASLVMAAGIAGILSI